VFYFFPLSDPNPLPKNTQIILFDGVCNLCNDAVLFTIKRDKKKVFRYASLQSSLGKKLLAERGINSKEVDSIILINPKIAFYIKSTAVLQASKKLGGLYPLLSVFLIIPHQIRDLVYDYVAHNRHKWFGKKDNCMIPSPELEKLFLDM